MRFTRLLYVLAALALASLAASCAEAKLPDGLYARLSTSKGAITIRLEYEKAPLTVCNFVGLAEGRLEVAKGKKYFNGLTFHRVEKDFVIQTGDPKGDGTGGPGYNFPDEIAADLKYDSEGIVGMANSGPDTNGSQFFITMKPTPALTGGYAIFGKVVSGMDVVKRIAVGDKLDKVSIIRSGAASKAFKVDQEAWNGFALALKKAADGKRADTIAAFMQKWPALVAAPDGTYQQVLKAGAGPTPTAGQTVSVRYKGMFTDGRVFDQSDLHGGVVDFQVGIGRIIPGWDNAVMRMNKGEKLFIVIPPELAYGTRGTADGIIPPKSFLAFEIELVALK